MRTTPDPNLLYNFRSLDTQRDVLTIRLYYPLTYGENNPLIPIAKNIRHSKRNPKVPSTLHRIIRNNESSDFANYITLRISKHPPWLLDSSSIDMSLQKFPKSITSPDDSFSPTVQNYIDLFRTVQRKTTEL